MLGCYGLPKLLVVVKGSRRSVQEPMSRATCITGLFRKNSTEVGSEGSPSVTTESILSRCTHSESVTSGRGLFQGWSVTSDSILSNRGTRSESVSSARGVLQGSVSSAMGLFSQPPTRSAKRRLNSAIHKMSAGKPLYSGEPNDCGSLLVYAQCIAVKFAARNRTLSVFRAWDLRRVAAAAAHESYVCMAESLWQDRAHRRKAAIFRQWRFHRLLEHKKTIEAAETMQGRLQARFEECVVAEAVETKQEWLRRMRQDRIRRLSHYLRIWQQQLCMRRCSRVQRQLRLRRSLRHWRRSCTSHSCRSERRSGGVHDLLAQESFAARLCFARDFALLRGVVDAWSSCRLAPVARTPIAGRWRSKATKGTPSPPKLSKPPRIPLGPVTSLIDKENRPQAVIC